MPADRHPQAPTGRFAPSPTGPLHAGSLVAALASWLDARARGGRWLVRIEDVDVPRCSREAEEEILRQLHALHLRPDEPPVRQAERSVLYQNALQQLISAGLAYPCACTRKEIEGALRSAGIVHERHAERVYPGTCRSGLQGRMPRAVRFHTEAPGPAHSPPSPLISWQDRRLGPQRQDVSREVGDFVLRRADGLWAYQLAVVVDDAAQGITHVVRGEDLADNTARQIQLQRALGLPTPEYLHTPLVLAADRQKLSKQNGAAAVPTERPLSALLQAARHLDLPDPPGVEGSAAASTAQQESALGEALRWWATAWTARWCAPAAAPV